MTDMVWLATHEDDGHVAFRIGRAGDTLVAEWVGVARLLAKADGSWSRFEPEPGARPEDLEKIRRGGATLLLRHLEGRIALHGAAVGREGRAVALLGRSGQGKSTLAAAICAHGAAALFADDALALDESDGRHRVLALEENHWIDEAARGVVGLVARHADAHGKCPVAAPTPAERSAELVAVVDLVFADVAAPALRRLSGVDALGRLVPQAVRFAIDDGERHVRELDALADLVARVPVYALERPRDLDRTTESVALVAGLLRREKSPS